MLNNMAKTLLAFLALVIFSCANAEMDTHQLVLSKNIALHYKQPDTIAHQGEMLIFKYSDWYFSHETVNPKTIYNKIDLTGLERDYIKSMFDKKYLDDFPQWLQELSKEQAAVFGINKNTASHTKKDFGTIYQVYDEKSGQGQIYILEERQIHSLQVHSDKERFLNLVATIKGR